MTRKGRTKTVGMVRTAVTGELKFEISEEQQYSEVVNGHLISNCSHVVYFHFQIGCPLSS